MFVRNVKYTSVNKLLIKDELEPERIYEKDGYRVYAYQIKCPKSGKIICEFEVARKVEGAEIKSKRGRPAKKNKAVSFGSSPQTV